MRPGAARPLRPVPVTPICRATASRIRRLGSVPAIGQLDCITALMDEAMMVGAEHHEVGNVRGAAASPVLDMVGVQKPGVAAPGKPAGPIPGLERPSERRRDGPGPPTHGQRPSVTFEDPDDRRITPQASDRLWKQRWAVLEVGALHDFVGRQRLGVDMDDDLARVRDSCHRRMVCRQ